MISKMLLAVVLGAIALGSTAPDAPAERVAGVKVIKDCGKRAHPKKCRWRRHRLIEIKPHIRNFLGPVGACESATGSHNLRVGLRALNPSGKYRGRYQFDLDSWDGAGGEGDPINASWLEQAFRAVRWLKLTSIKSWPECGQRR
jgi:hypothetical protein